MQTAASAQRQSVVSLSPGRLITATSGYCLSATASVECMLLLRMRRPRPGGDKQHLWPGTQILYSVHTAQEPNYHFSACGLPHHSGEATDSRLQSSTNLRQHIRRQDPAAPIVISRKLMHPNPASCDICRVQRESAPAHAAQHGVFLRCCPARQYPKRPCRCNR